MVPGKGLQANRMSRPILNPCIPELAWHVRHPAFHAYCRSAGTAASRQNTVLQTVFSWHFVEIPGFEPGQTEPKSVVLPLHHISITVNWPQMYIIFAKPSNYLFPLKKSLIRRAHSSASTPETTEVLGWSSDGE